MRTVFIAMLLILSPGALEHALGDNPKVQSLDALKTLIKPRAEETKWEEIPWMVDLWDARRKAAEAGKPLMLWEMDGNPMGCG